MVVARRCTVLVVDGTGKPLAGQKAGRGWAFGSIQTLEDGYTARDGTVTFDRRVQNHSVLGRCLAEVVNVAVVHGDAHISDGYLVSYPDGYTAEIDSDAPIKWVYGEGHLASVDLGGLPRDKNCRVKFILKRGSN